MSDMSENLSVLKFVRGDTVHRQRCDTSKISFEKINDICSTLYNLTGFEIGYKDEENELITISNNADLAEALLVAATDKHLLRIFVIGGNELTPSKVKQNAAALAFKNRHVKPKTETKAPAALKKAPSNAAALAFKNRHVKPKTKTKAKPPAAATSPKPSKPVPLEVTSGGAKLFLDGTIEFGLGGEAVIQKDGTVRCIMNGNGFPSVKAQNLSIHSGKWYYEVHLLTGGCMQVGWVTPNYTGDATQGNGVGDDDVSYAYDGYRQLRWHKSQETPWGKKWKAGDTVCCTVDCERGELRYALNGQWPSYADSVCFNGVPVQELGGLTPAVSFSNGEKCRFNFGADGTPLAHGPPDPSFLPIWNAYGTVHNVASTPVGRRGGGGGHSMPSSHGESKQQSRSRCPEKEDPHLQLLQLINRDSVRASISKALSNPLVAQSIQDMMEGIVMNGMMNKGPEQTAALEQTFKTQCVKLLPVGLSLVAEHPELISVATTLMHVLKENGVVGNTGSPFAGHHHRHHHHHKSKCPRPRKGRCGASGTGAATETTGTAAGGGANGRANRDPNWRHHVEQVLGSPDLIGEHIRRWSGKIVETASTVANHVHEAATGAQAREQLDADNLKKAIEESTKAVQSLDEQALLRAVSLSLSETEETAPVEDEQQGEAKEHVHPPVPANVVAVIHKPKAKFMKDGIDGGRHTDMLPGQSFQHTWRLMNNGSSAWSEHVTVRCIGGDAMKGSEHSVVVPAGIAPNQLYDATIELIAPEVEGRYICYFRLHDGDARFGDRIWIDLTVRAASKEKKQLSEGDAATATDGGESAVVSEDGVLPVFNDEDEDALLNAAVDESLKTSSSIDDLTDWDMVSDSMRAAAVAHAAAAVVDAPVVDAPVVDAPVVDAPVVVDTPDPSVTKEESQGETKTDSNAVESAPPSYVDVAKVPEVADVASEEMTDERIKNQLEKLVELGFSEKAAATALVQCNGDLGGAVTLLLASSGRLG